MSAVEFITGHVTYTYTYLYLQVPIENRQGNYIILHIFLTPIQNNLSWKLNSVINIMPPIMPTLEAAAAAACATLKGIS